MGNDGGSIPKRRELVKNSARAPTVSELKATAFESLGHAWTTDPLTTQPLDLENVVSDWRGRLYNYESVLKNLMPTDDNTSPSAESQEASFASTGIKSLRDIVKLQFKRYTPPGTKGKGIWACPVSLKELGPGIKSVYLVPCGHVFADVAIKEIQEETCPECNEPFKAENVIPILPTEDVDTNRLLRRLEDLKADGLTHSLKKDKSVGKKKRKADEEKNQRNGDAAAKQRTADGGEMAKKTASSRISGINNALAASLTAKVLAEQQEMNKRRKLAAPRV